jgi:tyrosyl-DNA phosphodiesterase-1
MSDEENGQESPRKRVRIDLTLDSPTNSPSKLPSITAPVSPPRSRSRVSHQAVVIVPSVVTGIPSPFQLTRIKDLPPALNIDAVSLKEILGDPLIAECWEFNYLHDVDFLMNAFDEDVRNLVKVHVVHGFWKNEDKADLQV